MSEDLLALIKCLQERIESLEQENVETSNCLYELSNRIDALEGYKNIPSRY